MHFCITSRYDGDTTKRKEPKVIVADGASLTPQDFALIARELIDRVSYLELIETHNALAVRIRLGYASMPTTYELRRAIQMVTGDRVEHLALPGGDEGALVMWYFHREVRACLTDEAGIGVDVLTITDDVSRGEALEAK